MIDGILNPMNGSDYLKRMDEDARAIRDRFQAYEAMRARSFDPRRSELLQIFDSLDNEGKDKALEMLIGKT